ncbi:MAG TPA: bifunctional hydroxymethylpyrimidine kinase/phosphomethylpyrimidine kinase [Candidatus Baltobacteraceae bacterium]
MSTPVVSIGTTHPANVAGLGRDARVAADWGVKHVMAVAAVSAQDERGVHDLFALPPGVLRGQLGAIDVGTARAVRVGAMGSKQNAIVASEFLEHLEVPVVFDPVMDASAGGSLYADDALAAVRLFLHRVRTIVTPNTGEAQRLTGIAISGVDEMIAAGKALVERGARAAIVKGGHLPGDPVDVLVAHDVVETFVEPRLPQMMRGTGCTLAMALACELALGRSLPDALKGARAYVRANIARS